MYLPCDGFTISIEMVGALVWFYNFSNISSARTFSLGLVVGNSVGNDVGDGVAGVLVYGFGAGV